MPSRFEKFSERARRVLSLAQEEAQRFNHNYIGTEHILLGLVRETEGVAARVLSNLNVELVKVRSAVEFIIGRGERPTPGEIGLTPRAKKVIELAVDEARRLNHHYIGTEHLLLGLVRQLHHAADRGFAVHPLRLGLVSNLAIFCRPAGELGVEALRRRRIGRHQLVPDESATGKRLCHRLPPWCRRVDPHSLQIGIRDP